MLSAARTCRYCSYRFDGRDRQLAAAVGRPYVSSQARVVGSATMGAGALMVLGSLLPWVQAVSILGPMNANGIQSFDGVVALALGAVTVFIGASIFAAFDIPRFIQSSPIVTGAVGALIAMLNMVDVMKRANGATRVSDSLLGATVGAGLWLLLAASVAAAVLGVAHRFAEQ